MDNLEAQARQEFARILTNAVRTINGCLDGKTWGRITADELSAERFGANYVRLDYQGMGILVSMHASDRQELCNAAARLANATVKKKGTLYYCISAEEITLPTREGLAQ